MYSEKILFGLGVDSKGKKFTDSHFGDADKYLIYEYNPSEMVINLVKEIKNPKFKEERHGDPKKAKNITELLKGIDVLVGYEFGPNIVRIKKNFQILISYERDIDKFLNGLEEIIDEIIDNLQIEDPNKRSLVKFRKEKEIKSGI